MNQVLIDELTEFIRSYKTQEILSSGHNPINIECNYNFPLSFISYRCFLKGENKVINDFISLSDANELITIWRKKNK